MQQKCTQEVAAIIERTKEIVDTRYPEEFLPFNLARTFGASTRNRFLSFFKEHEGETFWDFLKSVRVQKSKKLLMNSAYTEKQVALKVGFGNATTFRRAFKIAFGESPTDYRKRIGRRVCSQD